MKINNKKIRIIYMSIIGFLLPIFVGFFLHVNLILLSIFIPFFIILISYTKPETRFLTFGTIIVAYAITIYLARDMEPYQWEGEGAFAIFGYMLAGLVISLCLLFSFLSAKFHFLANKKCTNENDKKRFFSKSTNYFIVAILLLFFAMFLFSDMADEPTSLPVMHNDFFDDYDY